MMSTRKISHLLSLCLYANVLLLFSCASSYTDPLDVKTIEDLYGLLNQTTLLTGWMATGGDPCGQNWTGVSCSGSSITSIEISGLGLGGTMTSQLSSLLSLTQLSLINGMCKEGDTEKAEQLLADMVSRGLKMK